MLMKILIDVPQEQAVHLTLLAGQSGKPRAALIREALIEYQAKHRRDMTQYYGLWAGNPEAKTTEAYLTAIRSEWDR